MKYLALDIEAVGLKPYGGTVWIIALYDGVKMRLFQDCNGIKKLPADVIKLLQDDAVCKVIHNASYDATYLECVLGVVVKNLWDTQICETLIQGMRISSKHKNKKLVENHNCALENVLPRYGFPKPNKDLRKNFIDRPKGIPFTQAELDYAQGDVQYLLELQKAQEYILDRDGMLELALLENKTTYKIARMRAYGIGFDQKFWRELAIKNQREFYARSRKLPAVVSNWNSPAQVKKYFFNKGIYIDSYDNLEEVYESSKNKTLGDFIHARELHKAVTSYGLNWFDEDNAYIDADGRIRCNFDQIVDTGRMSASKPNLQQLPKPRIGPFRGAFVAKKGHVFVIGDFTGQELGIMAAAANERIWIEAMLRGDDIHCLVASLLYAELWAQGTTKSCSFPAKCSCPNHVPLREAAKTLNFMLAYGGGAEKFSKKTGVSLFDSKVIIARYKQIIPRITYWLKKNGQLARNTGETYTASPYKRRRVLMSAVDWHVDNQGKNSPIQGAGADMLKLTMISLPDKFPLALVIHDEIVLEVPRAQGKQAAKVLKEVMEQAADYITGIKGLIKSTPRIATNLLKKE